MILYFGNKLSKWGRSLSVIETLTPLLAKNFCIQSFSNKENQLVRILDMIFHLIRYKRDTKVVLIDSYSTFAFWYTIIIAFLCKRFDIPYITIVHGGNFPFRLKKSPRITHYVFRSAAEIVSPSFYLKEAFERHKYKVACIPNSLCLSDFPFLLRKSVSGNLLWVRSFHEIYNPCMAIEVLMELKKKFPAAKLCMVGGKKDSSFEQVMRRIDAFKLSDSVSITGALARTAWVELSMEYDVFINTSSVDNTPLSILEAMSLGFPVVSTNVGGVPYLISDCLNGLLVDSNDSKKMAERICFLIENPLVAQGLGVAGRAYVEKFDWGSVQTKWYDLLSRYTASR